MKVSFLFKTILKLAQKYSGSKSPGITEKPQQDHEEKINLPESHNKIIVVDIDGVLAAEQYHLPLEQRTAIEEAQDSIRFLKEKGYIVILNTSRFRSQQKATLEWLKKNDIPFDDILFEKPRGILYIDDRAYRFKGWKQFFNDVAL